MNYFGLDVRKMSGVWDTAQPYVLREGKTRKRNEKIKVIKDSSSGLQSIGLSKFV